MALKKNNSQVQVITVTPPSKEAVKRKRLTGRLLVRLNPSVPVEVIEKKAKARSLRLVSLRDLPADGGLSKALEKADGVLFDRLKVVLVNAGEAGKIKRLLALRDSPFLSSEPERYLYKAAGAKRPVFKNTGSRYMGHTGSKCPQQ